MQLTFSLPSLAEPSNASHLATADALRGKVSATKARKQRAALGQFMTPAGIARFMASLFSQADSASCRLLDAGAGVGALTCAFLDRCVAGELRFSRIETTAYEIDTTLCADLAQTLGRYENAHTRVKNVDFIIDSTVVNPKGARYTHAILNPPYKKIHSASEHRVALRSAGIETVNLYSGFVALALQQAAVGGELVAIIPRSFCNGPYYRPFRELLLAHAAIRRMHLFASRAKAFSEDDVLQENVIIHLERGGRQGLVQVSTSTDATFSDLTVHEYAFDQIVLPNDLERFIHVPTSPTQDILAAAADVDRSLSDIGIRVSTGPVVDFRMKAHLRPMPSEGTIPLLYPCHFVGQETAWPQPASKKPNSLLRNAETERWLYPNGFYCVVRRFSAKEERRRIVASVLDPRTLGDADVVGFENHLNVFHENRQPLTETLARGLAVFLNSTAVDDAFRRFNGHTQVNATDLKLMKYPKRETLIALGQWSIAQGELSQAAIDQKIESLFQ